MLLRVSLNPCALYYRLFWSHLRDGNGKALDDIFCCLYLTLQQAKYYSPGSFEPEDILPKPALPSGLTASNPDSLVPVIKAPAVVPAPSVGSRLHLKESTKSKGQTTNKPGDTVMGALEKNKSPINQKSIKPKSPELDSGRPLFAESGPKKG